MENKKEISYWPHMIVGFLFLAIALGYWTIKTAISLPVQETNDYMMKYQKADININDILTSKEAFDKEYIISLSGIKTMVMTDNIYSNKVQPELVVLSNGINKFNYIVKKRDGIVVKDAKVSFLLTRPHSTREDKMIEVVPYNGKYYQTPDINISKAGRYTLKIRATVNNKTGYWSVGAYLKPTTK